MKTRNGFVSNSSSSSYIVAFSNMNRPDLKKLFISNYYGDGGTKVNAVGIKEVINVIKERLGIGTDRSFVWGTQDEMDRYDYEQFIKFAGIASKIAKVVENGKNIALIQISYNDNNGAKYLNNKNIFDIIEEFA